MAGVFGIIEGVAPGKGFGLCQARKKMAYRIDFESDGRGVIVAWEGIVMGDEILAANEAMYAGDPDRKLRYQIWDFLGATSLHISHEQIRKLALRDKEADQAKPGQVVALAGTPEFFRGSEQVYAAYASEWTGFRSEQVGSMDEATAWVVKTLADRDGGQ